MGLHRKHSWACSGNTHGPAANNTHGLPSVLELFFLLGLAEAFPEDLLKPLFEAIIDRTRIDPKHIQDVCIGNVLQPGGGALSSRIAQFLANLPDTIPINTVNRQCSSGLQVGSTRKHP